ncbi:hypothetical protein [Nocardia pneumoniae]|uniref:hypothetical protein n=1 Tax=Nocardia pneumoniae TaxID=228601 RepID=UPI0012F63A11|nr:hypothetical protein [Nocardia pneumoniae]
MSSDGSSSEHEATGPGGYLTDNDGSDIEGSEDGTSNSSEDSYRGVGPGGYLTEDDGAEVEAGSGGGSTGLGDDYVDPAANWSDAGPRSGGELAESEGAAGDSPSGSGYEGAGPGGYLTEDDGADVEAGSGAGSTGLGDDYVDPAANWSDAGPRDGRSHDFVTELPDGSFRVHYPWLGGGSEELNATIELVEQWAENCLGLIGINDSRRIKEDLRDLEYFLKNNGLVSPEDVGLSTALDRYRGSVDQLNRIESNLEYRDTGVEHISTEELPKELRRARSRVENTLNDLGETLTIAADEGLGRTGDGEFNQMTSAREREILGSLSHAVDEIETEIHKVSKVADDAARNIDEHAPDHDDDASSSTAEEEELATVEEQREAAEEELAVAEAELAAVQETAVTQEELAAAVTAAQASGTDESAPASGSDDSTGGADSDNSDDEDPGPGDSGSPGTEPGSNSDSETDQTDEDVAAAPPEASSDSSSGMLEMLPMLAMSAISALVPAIQPLLSGLANQSDQQNNDTETAPDDTPAPAAGAPPEPGGAPDAAPPPDAAAADAEAAPPPPTAAMSWGTVDMTLPDGTTQKVSPAVAEAVNKELNNPNGSDARAAYTGTSAGPWTAVDTAAVRTGDILQWAEIEDSDGVSGATVQSDHTALVVETGAGRQIIVGGQLVPLDPNNPPIEKPGGRSEFRGFFRPSGAGVEAGGESVTTGAAATSA